jgi:hypothetical protein
MDNIVILIKKNALNILIGVAIIIILLVFINVVGFDLNATAPKLHLTQQVTVETFGGSPVNLSDTNENIEKLDVQPAESFCKSYLGNSAALEPECNNLTESNCADVSCCVYVKNGLGQGQGKCVAGTQNGPTFNNNKIGMESYYYLGKKY